jgi:Hemerythrin HHE cation binding domain
MMGVVHGALSRDLRRARVELTTEPYPQGLQRRALGEHLGWVMDFLHHHHLSEDDGLWPLVRRHNPDAADLLDSLAADHARVLPAAASLTEAARRYAETAGEEARIAVLAALDVVTEVLLPHLDREVADAMPVVEASVSKVDFDAWENQYNVKPKSMRQLGFEGHWMLDDATPEERAVVVGVVPPIPRFILLRGFARSYRKRREAIWRAGVSR